MVAAEPRRIVIERSRPGSRLPPCLLHRLRWEDAIEAGRVRPVPDSGGT